MTVEELKEELNKFPDDMEIGGCDYFGRVSHIENISIKEDANFKPLFVEIEINGYVDERSLTWD